MVILIGMCLNIYPGISLAGSLVGPDCVRVWRGYKIAAIAHEKFREKLRSIFIPGTPQFQAQLGMTAYLPAVIPDAAPVVVPDEIALVFYESKQVYSATYRTIAGRAYGALHETIFQFGTSKESHSDMSSKSGWPVLFTKAVAMDVPYYLHENRVDWKQGSAKVLVAVPLSSRLDGTISEEKYHDLILRFATRIRRHAPVGMDSAILVKSREYLLYWEHWQDQAEITTDHLAELFENLKVIMLTEAVNITVSAALHDEYDGLKELTGGAFLNVQFETRK